MKIIVSIVIPTYKRKDSLLRLLKSLKTETDVSTEVIIIEQVFNNEEDYKKSAIKNKINLKYFFLKDASTSKAKNYGEKKAEGEYILFLDDDVIAKKGLINNHFKNFKDKNICAVVGRCVTVGQEIELEREDVGKITFLGKFTDGFTSNIKQKVDTVIGCNAFWRKDIFDKINGFDEQFTGNAMREESDLSLRARKLGYRIIYDPTAEIEHLREETGGNRKTEGRIKWYFDLFSNETYLFLKHRPKFIVPIILLTRWEWAFRCMFGFGREVSIRSITTPFFGIYDGCKKYWRYKYENRR